MAQGRDKLLQLYHETGDPARKESLLNQIKIIDRNQVQKQGVKIDEALSAPLRAVKRT